ncbi:hypothetical protein QN277_015515 [Acacia crassicarpa]|uniref:Uncharacterized protein n=1 Tax=Acacia crassicarpa TaxID=499986 RepID=A0AAE1JUC9_9FABA|nr:hypothetical protein QN277_015515 [Acacia crassicarpa]
MTTPQASLFYKPHIQSDSFIHHSSSLSFPFILSLQCYTYEVSLEFHNLRFRLRGTFTFCTSRWENVSSRSQSNFMGDDISSVDEESDIDRTGGGKFRHRGSHFGFS